jgi:chromosome segregation ATPase
MTARGDFMDASLYFHTGRAKRRIKRNGGHEMNDNFQRLFDSVEQVREKQTEREQIIQSIAEVRRQAGEHFDRISEEYREKEKQIIERMQQAETENRENKENIVKLTAQQIQAETAGEPFGMKAELDRLKVEVTNYPLKVEAMQQIKEQIAVPLSDAETMEEYRREWQQLESKRRAIADEMQGLLTDIAKNDILFCIATFENVPGRHVFLSDDMQAAYDGMRKEQEDE